MKPSHFFLLFLLTLLPMMSAQPQQEWRAFWVDAWNKGLLRPEQVKQTVETARDYGYNAIVVQIRRRGDALYFPSANNGEPRLAGLAAGYDPLQMVIDYARAADLEVHAWITTFLVASAPPSQPEHVYHRHPEYLMENSAGEKKISEGYYLDPGNPQALEWNRRVVMDIVENYDIDGFHFDYVRYPAGNSGYNSVAIARYNEEFGSSGKPKWDDERFSAWRRRQITDWLRKMHVRIVSSKPHMKVTAATFANRQDAYGYRFQDWAQWMREGIVDAHFPMNYSRDEALFRRRVDDILTHRYQRHVYMGGGAYILPIEETARQLQYARDKGCEGLLFFSYANNNGSGKSAIEGFRYFQQQLFTFPAEIPQMPWKSSEGYICGRVTDAAGTVYNACLTIENSDDTVLADVLGEYAFLRLSAGSYTVVCEAPGKKVVKQRVAVIAGNVSRLDFFCDD